MIKKTLLLIAASALLMADISYNDALKIPSVKEFPEQTGLPLNVHLKKAIKNKHWQIANQYLLGKTVKVKHGNKELVTIPYKEIMKELKIATAQGSVLSAFQGYRVSAILTHKTGKYAKIDTGFFARALMENNICIGYVETSFGYAHKWYSSKVDYENALKVINAGYGACNKKGLPGWLVKAYKENRAQFKAMVAYTHE